MKIETAAAYIKLFTDIFDIDYDIRIQQTEANKRDAILSYNYDALCHHIKNIKEKKEDSIKRSFEAHLEKLNHMNDYEVVLYVDMLKQFSPIIEREIFIEFNTFILSNGLVDIQEKLTRGSLLYGIDVGLSEDVKKIAKVEILSFNHRM